MKRISALLVSLVLLFSCTAMLAVGGDELPLQAIPYDSIAERDQFLAAVGVPIPDEDAEALAGGLTCSMCLQGTLNMTYSYTSWVKTGQTRQCSKNWLMLDYEESRVKTTTYQCNVCGYGFHNTSTETRWVCTH